MLVHTPRNFRTPVRPTVVKRNVIHQNTHIPPTVSQSEFDLHQISHFPFRSWCDHSVRGKEADGKTPYERFRNRAFHVKVLEFADTVHHKDPANDIGKMADKWHVGVWLGKSTACDEQYHRAENDYLKELFGLGINLNCNNHN